MEERKDDRKKGGRPKKAVKMDQLLGVKCTLIERKAIEARARSVGLSVSEFLRKMGLTGKIDRNERVLPKEVLQYRGTLNHAAANINQIAHKRNRGDELNALERAELFNDVKTVVQASKAIIDYLK
ncbi:MAG TPA: hypothetical protein VHE34_00775 [Puia sp.]|uniref:plasmid mobilization protein n=1 Tax=Puia sp. TaxID=2045100 RepID=UPI002BD3F4CC|nr:mobilization protein [Puia sp.]HVU93718.1 hypothetical protein [Puia sp.]